MDSNEKYVPDLSEPIYRCGWCGNMVDYDGKELSKDMINYKIGLLVKYPYDVTITRVDGNCCKEAKRNGIYKSF